MAKKVISWNKGGGNITITYPDSGSGNMVVQSTANSSFDERSQVITISTTKGFPSTSVNRTVRQAGKTYEPGKVFNFPYTGSVQSVTLPKGRYKLQCWGAQGGDTSYSGYAGSDGGYSEGIVNLTETTTLYIFVGGQGASSGNGGWNGGGGSSGYSSWDADTEFGESWPACGGGATDICLITSDMGYNASTKRNNRSEASLLSRFIVAGGGAGASEAKRTLTTHVDTSVYIDLTISDYGYFIDFGGTLSEASSYDTTDYAYIGDHTGENIQFMNRNLGDESIGCEARFFAFYDSNKNFIEPLHINESSCVIPTNAYYVRATTYANYSSNNALCTQESPAIVFVGEKYDDVDYSYSNSNGNQQGGGTTGLGRVPGRQDTDSGFSGGFGWGGTQESTAWKYTSGAGGSGWYGGGKWRDDSDLSVVNFSGGGSGFVNTAANAKYRPSGYNGLQLASGLTKFGNNTFPSPNGGNETGHAGNGYARITVL